MENEQLIDDQISSNNGLEITQNGQYELISATKWVTFMAILGFIGVGFMLIGAIIAGFAGGFALLGSLVYIGFAVLYFIPIMNLFRFAQYSKIAVRNQDSSELTRAISQLKAHYKFIGILTIILIVIYALFFLVIGAGALGSLSRF